MILALFLGIGEIVAVKTKAYIGSTFIMMALLLIAFWCGLDPEIVTKSQAVALGTICIGLLMVNLATSISLKEFLKQWKTIIIGLGAVVFIALFCGGIGSLLMGKLMAFSGTPIVAGGINAYLIISGRCRKRQKPGTGLRPADPQHPDADRHAALLHHHEERC